MTSQMRIRRFCRRPGSPTDPHAAQAKSCALQSGKAQPRQDQFSTAVNRPVEVVVQLVVPLDPSSCEVWMPAI